MIKDELEAIFKSIADAIREKGVNGVWYPNELSSAILDIGGGGGGGDERIQPSADPSVNVTNINNAIQMAALETPPGKVLLASGVFQINNEITVHDGVVIEGNGMTATTIYQTVTGKRVMKIQSNSKVTNLRITNGNCADEGAGLKIESGGSASYCIINGNACTGGGKSGGGISFSSSYGSIDHCIVYGNTIGSSSWGAGIGGRYVNGNVSITCCLVYDNEDTAGSGGGIGFQNYSSGNLTINSCTIVKNRASMNVGGVYFNDISGSNPKLSMKNNIITNNTYGGSNECNTFIDNRFFDQSNSSNCDITGSLANFNVNIYRDVGVRGMITNVMNTDPLFVSDTDYHLQTTSPVKNQGVQISGLTKDLDDKNYSTPPTIGCYEI